MPAGPVGQAPPPVHTSLLPTSDVMTRLIALIDQERTRIVGSASEIQREGKVYIVTAYHVFRDAIGSADHMVCSYNEHGSALPIRVVGHDMRMDVSVFAVAFPSTKRRLEAKSERKSALGQDVLCLGFAKGLRHVGDFVNNGWPIPLTTRATIAFADSSEDWLLIDRHSAGGMSGGLVVNQHIDTFAWQVVGIPVCTINDERVVNGSRFLWPSGFTKVVALKVIHRIIDANPIGTPIEPLPDTESDTDEQNVGASPQADGESLHAEEVN